MAGYGSYLKALLRPLGIYDLKEGTYNGSELEAMGAALDEVAALLEKWERESITATAEGEGLDRRAALFSLRGVDAGVELRRAALAALETVGGDSFTPEAVSGAIQGCGIAAQVLELPEWGHLRVIFPHTAGIPDHFEQIRQVIDALIPCHLEIEYYFRYLTWAECEQQNYTWKRVEDEAHTWESFLLAVPA